MLQCVTSCLHRHWCRNAHLLRGQPAEATRDAHVRGAPRRTALKSARGVSEPLPGPFLPDRARKIEVRTGAVDQLGREESLRRPVHRYRIAVAEGPSTLLEKTAADWTDQARRDRTTPQSTKPHCLHETRCGCLRQAHWEERARRRWPESRAPALLRA
jgi:hypothetical protein